MSHVNALDTKLSAIAKSGNIQAEVLLGETSFVTRPTHAVIARNEGSHCSVQLGSMAYGEYNIDENVLPLAQSLLDALEHEEESGDFGQVEDLSFIILESGEYRLYLQTDEYSKDVDFIDITQFHALLKNKLYQ